MTKAFFEKLTSPQDEISTQDSVIRNVDRILRFGSFLDAGVDSHLGDGLSHYHNGQMSVVDISLGHSQQIVQFQTMLAQSVQMFEPRIKDVQVLDIMQKGQASYCQLRICLYNEVFEHGFTFD